MELKLTDEEASTLWCPMARVNGSNRTERGVRAPGSECIGSRCALWVVDNDAKVLTRVAENQRATRVEDAGKRPPDDCEFVPATARLPAHWRTDAPARGHCGLIGGVK